MDERSGKADEIVRRDRVTITAVVATYNEERYIGTCLSALLAQRTLPGPLEILVIDGMSTDRTVDIVHTFAEYGHSIRLLQNPKRLQVYAWNIALREMRGEYLALVTAHGDYDPEYFSQCWETLHRTGAAAVSPVQRAVGEGYLGRAIAWCMSSPFGVGGARFRYAEQEEECESVPMMFAGKETIDAVGGWDERIPFDEDSDLAYRLRKNGAKLVVSARIGMRYHVRRSLKALWMQMFRYGYWRRFTQLKHPGSVPWRVLAPAALLAGAAVSAVLLLTPLRVLAGVVPVLYCAFLAAATIAAIPRAGLSALAVPAALATMHAAYGTGWWKAFFSMGLAPLAGIFDRSPAR